MRYISVFSGIEAASCAWEPLGWEPLCFCEVDGHASSVLRARYPHVPNLGDITKIEWKEFRGRADVVVGGSPCQSFSVAGDRTGLAGASGLMYEYVRCVLEVRPRWFLWENVPGALSSEHGDAFRQLLSEMAVGGGYGLCWRILDAQFFGVAQRRRRLFLVGRAGNGFREACQVLFESDCVPGNSATSKARREELAAQAGRSPRAAGFCNAAVKAGSIGYEPEQHPTLRAGSNLASTGAVIQSVAISNQNIVRTDRQSVCIAANQRGEIRMDGGDGQTVGAIPATRSGKQLQGVLCMASGQANAEVGEDVGTTLSARQYKDPPITVVTRCGCDGGGKGALASENVSLTLSTRNEQSLLDPNDGPRYVVRRLTPVECERLQGFPDGWTDVEDLETGKPMSDAQRYKQVGNSMAVPVMRWIGERMGAVDAGEDPDALDPVGEWLELMGIDHARRRIR